jgi:hypothetical protein
MKIFWSYLPYSGRKGGTYLIKKEDYKEVFIYINILLTA